MNHGFQQKTIHWLCAVPDISIYARAIPALDLFLSFFRSDVPKWPFVLQQHEQYVPQRVDVNLFVLDRKLEIIVNIVSIILPFLFEVSAGILLVIGTCRHCLRHGMGKVSVLNMTKQGILLY